MNPSFGSAPAVAGGDGVEGDDLGTAPAAAREQERQQWAKDRAESRPEPGREGGSESGPDNWPSNDDRSGVSDTRYDNDDRHEQWEDGGAAGDSHEERLSSLGTSSATVNAAALLWRARRRLFQFAIAGGLASFGVSLFIPNLYQSTTVLMAPEMKSAGSEAMMLEALGRSGGLAGLGAGLLGGGNSGALFLGVLNSRSVADTLVQKFDLKKVYGDRRDQDARADLAERTSISEDHKSHMIAISVEDREPRRARQMATAYVEELNRLLVEVNTSSAHRERVFIEQRLRVIRPELDRAARQLSDFSAANSTLDPKEQGRAMVGAVADLEGELIANQTQLRGLQQIYGKDNVRIREAEARIAELRHRLRQLSGTGVAAQDSAAQARGQDGAQAPEKDEDKDKSNANENKEIGGIRASPSGGNNDDDDDGIAYPGLGRLPALGVTYADLYREVKLREAVVETLTGQYEMARIAEAKEIPSVKVLDPAGLPEKKSGPHRFSMSLLGTFLALAGAALWILASAVWARVPADDPRKRLAAEIGQDLRSARQWTGSRIERARSRVRSGDPEPGRGS